MKNCLGVASTPSPPRCGRGLSFHESGQVMEFGCGSDEDIHYAISVNVDLHYTAWNTLHIHIACIGMYIYIYRGAHVQPYPISDFYKTPS